VKSVLVTGGAGYIGSHACRALAQAGYEPVTYDNLSTGHRWAVRWGPLVQGDLANRRLLSQTFDKYRIGAVMHFAACAEVEPSMREPGKYFHNNVVNSLGLLETMLDAGVPHIVFSSTCATYGVPISMPIREELPQAPVNPYGESKRFVERALHWYGEAHDFKWVALRYFNAAGADPEGEIGEAHDPETHLIPLVVQAALGLRPSVEIRGTDYPTPDGTAVRDYIHVGDIAGAHVRALEYLRGGGRSCALNLGTGAGHSVRQVVHAVEHVCGWRVPAVEGPARPGDPPALVADSRRAGEVLGWTPRYTGLDAIVRSAWNWHAAQPSSRRAAAVAGIPAESAVSDAAAAVA